MSALIETADDTPSELDVAKQRPVNSGNAEFRRIDQQISLHPLQHLLLVRGRGICGIRLKLQPGQHIVRAAKIDATWFCACGFIQECVR